MKEAMFYEKLADGKVRCGLCRFRCLIVCGQRGICGVRENRGGLLYTIVYGKAIAEQVDPVEKKPLFHFLPGSKSYSVAAAGCNFRCLHCQNHQLSQAPRRRLHVDGMELAPEEIVRKALASGCRSISYTYTEPTVYYEYAYETALLARNAGLKNIFVTNGYITPGALVQIRPYLDAANIDLKGYSDKFYREVVQARVEEVLDSILEYKKLGIWVELTTLIIPNHNDSADELRAIARFIAEEVGVETPWHVTQFHPAYRLTDQPRTPLATMRRARESGLDAGLRYVYEGNLPGKGGENTCCPNCGKLLIRRFGFHIESNRMEDGRCPSCFFGLDGVWR
ncbi:MAG: AmmeMemoRadiSam system radical SAM enzyme [Deltaproteobacteria bacterium]